MYKPKLIAYNTFLWLCLHLNKNNKNLLLYTVQGKFVKLRVLKSSSRSLIVPLTDFTKWFFFFLMLKWKFEVFGRRFYKSLFMSNSIIRGIQSYDHILIEK